MTVNIVWFRKDLRLSDNIALFEAIKDKSEIIPLYILDENEQIGGASRWWLHHSLIALDKSIKDIGGKLILKKGSPYEILKSLSAQYQVKNIYWNRCYEPEAIKRDSIIKNYLSPIAKSFNSNLLFEPWKISNKSGDFFKVFTPFWKHCTTLFESVPEIIPAPTSIKTPDNIDSDNIENWNLLPKNPDWSSNFYPRWQVGEDYALKKLSNFIHTKLKNYAYGRDFPYLETTSELSPHLHFGEISPIRVFHVVKDASVEDPYNIKRMLDEIGWREFSYHLLYHFPDLPNKSFKIDFENFPWENNEMLLKIWQKGETGFPIVDAGMRELWHTGFMHNRLRMIVASFLIKNLFISWQNGANWFMDCLVDADLANNSASWQWVAGSGADAAPYFRVFNPILQSEKFDPEGIYLRKWLPEIASLPNNLIHAPWQADHSIRMAFGVNLGVNYPKPIVDYAKTREKALAIYHGLKS